MGVVAVIHIPHLEAVDNNNNNNNVHASVTATDAAGNSTTAKGSHLWAFGTRCARRLQ